MGYANHGGQSKKYRTAHIINSDICGNVHKPCSVGIGGGKNEKIVYNHADEVGRLVEEYNNIG